MLLEMSIISCIYCNNKLKSVAVNALFIYKKMY